MQTDETEKQFREIQKWLVEENISKHDKETILKFLSGCKYDTDKAKAKMKNYYQIRKTSPELFQGRDPLLKNIETLLDAGAFFPLPLKHPSGHTLVVVKAGANDPKQIPVADVFKVGIMSMDLLMELDGGITEHGIGVVVDLAGVGVQHALQMSPGLIRKMVHLWQDCYPIRIMGIDFVNVPRGVDMVLNVFRRFLKENLRQRLRTHGNQLESLHGVIEPKLLPEDYGGTLGPASDVIRFWKSKVQTYRHWFLDDLTLQ